MLIFVDVFTNKLMMVIGGMIVALAFCFYIIARLSFSKLHEADDSESFGLFNSIALVMLVLLQRDYTIDKNGLSTR